MIHRGPDDQGFLFQPPAFLGMRRLSVIDLSTGHQPIFTEDGRYGLVFNGEIYNYQEIREGLIARGHELHTNSDSEVIVHLFEEKGIQALSDLAGMFAIAIWDKERKSLFLARDRVGKKPLYIWRAPWGLAFASELKCMAFHPDFPTEVDPVAIHHYLGLGYVPAPSTPFRDVTKLLPGHWLTYEAETEDIRSGCYWRPETRVSAWTFPQACEAVRGALELSVRQRMISDVPLGAFLSGGVDSATVVALMSSLSSEPVRTFSIGFADARFDESGMAEKMARRFGAIHQTEIVDPRKGVECTLPLLAYHYDEPYGDSSALPTWHLSRLASSSVTVALTGDGGDEVFGGYDRYRAALGLDALQANPVSRFLMRFLAGFPMPDTRARTMMNRIRRFIESAGKTPEQAYEGWIGIFPEQEKGDLYTDWMNRVTRGYRSSDYIYAHMNGSDADLLSRLMICDTRTYLPGDLLPKVDIASMGHSLECRAPFLDHRLIDLVGTMPSHFKAGFFRSKIILRETFSRELPSELLRASKRGFGIPVDDWFRGELHQWSRDVLLDPVARSRNWFRPEGVLNLLKRHQENGGMGARIWHLVMLELWARAYLDKSFGN
jgi:asparagine synthase (glutamine-hydrolysing)